LGLLSPTKEGYPQIPASNVVEPLMRVKYRDFTLITPSSGLVVDKPKKLQNKRSNSPREAKVESLILVPSKDQVNSLV
jgi:hypothetical protein